MFSFWFKIRRTLSLRNPLGEILFIIFECLYINMCHGNFPQKRSVIEILHSKIEGLLRKRPSYNKRSRPRVSGFYITFKRNVYIHIRKFSGHWKSGPEFERSIRKRNYLFLSFLWEICFISLIKQVSVRQSFCHIGTFEFKLYLPFFFLFFETVVIIYDFYVYGCWTLIVPIRLMIDGPQIFYNRFLMCFSSISSEEYLSPRRWVK